MRFAARVFSMSLALGIPFGCAGRGRETAVPPPVPGAATRESSTMTPASTGDPRARVATESPRSPGEGRPFFEARVDAAEFFPRATGDHGLDARALADLVEGAEESRSSALIVLAGERVVVERYPSERDPARTVPLHSVTKVVGSLLVGALLGDGTLPPLDTRVGAIFPEWGVGRRAAVTLRHVLQHTAGLESEPSDLSLYVRRDTVAHARALQPERPPGGAFAYSNAGVQLIVGIIEALTRQPAEAIAEQRLFAPLGIRGAVWERDGAGHCLLYAGLSLPARDVARLGLLLASEGQWNGTQLVPSSWFREARRPVNDGGRYGLLLELYHEDYRYHVTAPRIAGVKAAGEDVAAALAPLVGQSFHYREELWLEAGALLDRDQRARLVREVERGAAAEPFEVVPGRQTGYGHSGTFGQYLMAFPERQLVFVRLVRGFDASRPRVDFEEEVLRVLRRSAG